MNKLKAFVGHSFTPEDEQLVRTFLKFFDQVKNMNIGFSWQHAESAEPKVLATKVFRLMEDANLFIGICTKKEAVVVPEKLQRGILNKSILKAPEEHLLWKTSDWIIQEIGFAVGRRMELILLVESGLRQPGGLQGDLEHIPFDRNATEKSFGKILEMIHALMPKVSVMAGEEPDIRATPEDKPSPEEKNGGDWLVPRQDWNRREFELALIDNVIMNNEKVVGEIYEAYLNSEDGNAQENRESWEAFHEYAKLIFGKGGSFARLRGMATDHPANSQIKRYLAKVYLKYGEHEKAARCFRMAAEMSDDAGLQLSSHGDAAAAFARSGQEQDAKAALENMRCLVSRVGDGESVLLKTLCEIAEHASDNDHILGLTERLLQLHPEDNDSRFNLAYRCSGIGYHDLALFHYLKVPYQERAAVIWNNLGVEFDHFALQSKSIKAYRKAEELGETLAMSNLAHKLIQAGFLEEAEEICDRAVKIKDYHKNVGYAISQIKEVPEKEDRKEKDIVGEATKVSEFYRRYGYALSKENVHDFARSVWDGKQCSLSIEIRGDKLVAEGTYEEKKLAGLLRLPGSGMESAQLPNPTKYGIRYEGIVTGFTVKGSVLIKEVGETGQPTGLLEPKRSKDVLMVISDDLKRIWVYEKGESDIEHFYTLTRH